MTRRLAPLLVLSAIAAGLLATTSPAAAVDSCSAARRVTFGEVEAQAEVALSADGEMVAFISNEDPLGTNEDGGEDVFRYDRILNRLRQLTFLGGGVQLPTGALDLSSDGSRVIFATTANPTGGNGDGNMELFAHGVLPSPVPTFPGIIQLTNTTGGTTEISAAIDAVGDTIAFSSDRNFTSQNSNANEELFVMSISNVGALSFNQVQATTGGDDNNVREIDLSIDGGSAVFLSNFNRIDNDDLNGEVLSADTVLDTVGQITDTVGSNVNSDPSTAANGTAVAFVSTANIPGGPNNGAPQVYVQGFGAPDPITSSAGGATNAEIDQSGERLVFQEGEDVVLFDRVDDTRRVVAPGNNPEMSSDGRRLVFEQSFPLTGGGFDEDLAISTCLDPTFTDVGINHSFLSEIEWMAFTGVSTGFQPGPTYKPGQSVSRAAMSAFMFRLRDAEFDDPPTATFNDVPTTSQFFTEIEWMAHFGITTGFPGGLYKPGAPVTRAAMSAFMFRLAGSPVFTDPPTATFNDVATTSQFFTEIEWMSDEGITTGFQPGPTYRPTAAVTRQAMSAFMQRLGERVALDPLVPPA